MNVCPSAVPVCTTSCTLHTSEHVLATRYVPGSISRWSLRPNLALNSSKTSLTTAQSVCRLVPLSVFMRATLYPPPRFMVTTSGNFSQSAIDMPVVLRHTAGSEPEPMWVWIRTTLQPAAAHVADALSAHSNQMPKDDAGPPTLVLPLPPEPMPGLKRRPTSLPGHLAQNFSTCVNEQQLTFAPRATSSSKPSPSSWDESEHFSGDTPAAIARRTSWIEEQSKWRPILSKSFRIAALGEDFIA
mmetsp:Transcript_68565/g.100391  ORF Transcript_68565/g.100391 Transcript_68565/m.100391 type:complete len:243 (-) Transcript_68565:198-926(-)